MVHVGPKKFKSNSTLLRFILRKYSHCNVNPKKGTFLHCFISHKSINVKIVGSRKDRFTDKFTGPKYAHCSCSYLGPVSMYIYTMAIRTLQTMLATHRVGTQKNDFPAETQPAGLTCDLPFWQNSLPAGRKAAVESLR